MTHLARLLLYFITSQTAASMTPYTAILNVTEDGVTLRCEVPGVFPKPKLEWQDSDGNALPAEEQQVSEKQGRYYVSLRSTVSRTTTNLFVCVARQEDIHHQTKAEIYVPGKLKHLTTQEKPGAERAKEIGSNGEITLDVDPDNRD